MIEDYFQQNRELLVISEKLLQARVRGDLLLQSGDVGWASAPSNIALLKYWGKKNGLLQIPENSSLSLTLPSFRSFTQVSVVGRFVPLTEGRIVNGSERPEFQLSLNQNKQQLPGKMEIFLRALLHGYADDIALSVCSVNNFPTACGVASSAAGYAALVGAVADLLNLKRFLTDDEIQLWISEWSRLGSGSATRSTIKKISMQDAQFVAWKVMAPENLSTTTSSVQVHARFNELSHFLLEIDSSEKAVESSQGHVLAQTSLFQEIRLAHYPHRFSRFCKAMRDGDFELFRDLAEWDALEMHSVMSTGAQPLQYLNKKTSRAIARFVSMRDEKSTEALWTLDAGANPHFVFLPTASDDVADYLAELSGDQMFSDAKIIFGETHGPGLQIGAESFARETLFESKKPLMMSKMSLAEAAEFFRSRGRGIK